MYSPLNNIEKIDNKDLYSEHTKSYLEIIKSKYNLSNEQLRILDLLTLEEFLAIKLEHALKIFNGNIQLPLLRFYKDSVRNAYKNLLDFYAKNNMQKGIVKSIALSEYRYFKIKNKILKNEKLKNNKSK